MRDRENEWQENIEVYRDYQSNDSINRDSINLKSSKDYIFYVNELGELMEIISPIQILGEGISRIETLIPPYYIRYFKEVVSKAISLSTVETFYYEMTIGVKTRYYEIRIIPILSQNSSGKLAVVIIKDITVERKSIDYLKIIKKICEETNDGILIFSKNNKDVRVNRAFYKIVGVDSQINRRDLNFFREFFSNEIFKLIKNKNRYFRKKVLIKKSNRVEIPVWITLNTIYNENSQIEYRVMIITDISEIEKSKKKLQYIASMDELTGLPNRRTLLEYLDKAIQYSLENKKVGAVCFIDLDSFKIINDTMGHKVGDKILKESADRIKSVIGKDDVFGRLGGDEFLLIINSIDKVDSLFNISQKIIVQINRPFVIDGVKHYIGVSIGISLFPYDSKSKEEILQFADMAMYKAKELGKNRYHFFTFELNNSLKRKGLIEKVLRFALEHDGFYLEFQPQVDVSTGAVVGLESLIRIKSSIAKDISPKEFIKVAEESNLIFDIGKWSIQRSCQQLYIWKQFYTIKKITISINLSKRQLLDEELAYFVDKVLTQFNIEPNWIEFEITEALILNSNERIVRNLRRLKDIGCHISIDDFGTGYLSLNTFKDKIVDKIKIDKSVIDNLVNNRDDRDIIKASITMANMMGLTIVAEGVEKEEQKKILSILGCKEIQGYFYSKPLKAEEALPLVVLDKSLKKSFF